MKTHFKLFALSSFATAAEILLAVVDTLAMEVVSEMASTGSLASTPNFVVPGDIALRDSLGRHTDEH